jgi:adenylylsulfate kinase
MKGVIWVTGLSAAGKTTLAKLVHKKMLSHKIPTIILDGDVLRECFDSKNLTSREERLKLGYSYSKLARMLSLQGVTVVIATIGLFKELHVWNRKNIPNYFEVFLDVPIDELIKRDPKDIYKRYYAGEIKNVAGLDFDVDFPENPDYTIKYADNIDSVQSAASIFNQYIEIQKQISKN